jgi:hypothetical protein
LYVPSRWPTHPSDYSHAIIGTKLTYICFHIAVNQNFSSTFQIKPESFEDDNYSSDGSHSAYAQGYQFTDTLTLGNMKITGYSMQIAYQISDDTSILGIGYNAPEITQQEDNLAVQMVSEGLIATEAYSLWLNDGGTTNGSLVFGAIDTAKYEGSLVTVNTFAISNQGWYVQLSALNASSPSGTDLLYKKAPLLPFAIVIGLYGSWLPQDLALAMWAVAGAQYLVANETAAIPCSRTNSAGTFDFQFGNSNGPVIKASLRHFIMPQEEFDLKVKNAAGEPMCIFTVTNTSLPDRYSLGEDFWKSVYLVADLNNQEVGMAQALYNVTTSNIVTFAGHGASIPSATSAVGQNTTTPSLATTATFATATSTTYAAAAGFLSTTTTNTGTTSPTSPTSSPTASGTVSPGDASGSSGLSTSAKIGVGVGVPIGVAIIGALLVFCWRSQRSRHPTYTPDAPVPTQQIGKPNNPAEILGPGFSAVHQDTPTSYQGPYLGVYQGEPAELSPSGTSPHSNSFRFSGTSDGYMADNMFHEHGIERYGHNQFSPHHPQELDAGQQFGSLRS